MESRIKFVLLNVTAIVFLILFVTAVIGLTSFAPVVSFVEPYLLPAVVFNLLLFFVSLS